MKQQPDLNKTIDKIENALHELSLNPKGGWTELMKSWGTPYYGNITNVLRKRGIAEPEGTGLKWVGDKPTRVLAGIVYEEAKEVSQGVRSKFKSKNIATNSQPKPSPCQMHDMEIAELPEPETQVNDDAIAWHSGENVGKKEVCPSEESLQRALAIMEKAMWHKVPDPVAFTLDVLKDGRI